MGRLSRKHLEAKDFEAKDFEAKDFEAKRFEAKDFEAKHFEAKHLVRRRFLIRLVRGAVDQLGHAAPTATIGLIVGRAVLEFKEGSGDPKWLAARTTVVTPTATISTLPRPLPTHPMPRHLILIPTEPERRFLAPRLMSRLAALPPADTAVELCGFGIAAAAARTAQLIAALRPERVILVGIAGRLDERLALGTATLFERIACHGIGVGSGSAFISAAALGWQQWPGDPGDGNPGDGDPGVGDELPCAVPDGGDLPRERLLLTVTAAAAGPEDVRLRKGMFPEASAEEMEGFAVALACRLFRIPCTIIRGISNTAGDRDKAHWQLEAPLAAAANLVLRLLGGER